jgi:branched-chain amino acid transport system substrate-binding protein
MMAPILLLLPGCGKRETIKIGAIISTESSSGPAVEGVEVIEGLAMAVEEINEHGGINGRNMELIHENPALDPEKAKQIFREMEVRHTPLFYLSTLSFMSVALAPLVEASSVVLIATAATTPDLTRNREWVFRFWPTAQLEAPVALSLLRELNIEHLGVLYLNDNYGRSIYKELQKGFNGSRGGIQGIPFELETVDFGEQVDSLLDNDAIYFVGFTSHLVTIAEELQAQNYEGVKIAPNPAAIPSIRAHESLDGVYVITPIVYNPGYAFAGEFRRRYEQRYNKPLSHYAPCGYDLIMLLADLLETRDIDRMAVKQALEGGFLYSGVLENLDVKPGEHDIGFPFFVARIVDGEVVYR